MRSRRKIVTFHHGFNLPGLDQPQPPGSYEVMMDEEQIPALTFIAWRRTGTSLRLPSLETESGQEQWITINPQDLAIAEEMDGKQVSAVTQGPAVRPGQVR